jgi:phage/plasmid-like protein (TIGR03299 family)
MSKETLSWLNSNTLVGFTDKRGEAWHYRASEQGTEPNHYAGAIPVADVERRLFGWTPVEGTVESWFVDPRTDKLDKVEDPTRKTIVRPDTGAILGIFRSGFQIHDYREWLLRQSEQILDADLAIGSAGLLRGGAVAWVQVELEDTISTPEGVDFRPYLTAATSLDGSLASTYQTGATVVVCDNTLSAALADTTHQLKIKHSKRSLGRLADVRAALDVVHSTADSFAAEVAQLCAVDVSEGQWSKFVEAHTGLDKMTEATSARARTNARNLADELTKLWHEDIRVTPWRGTAYGVLSAVNTYAHHVQPTRGDAVRFERNALRMVTGKIDELDSSTLATLERVLVG